MVRSTMSTLAHTAVVLLTVLVTVLPVTPAPAFAATVAPPDIVPMSQWADDDCPQGWSCSVATEDNVLVCRPGTATADRKPGEGPERPWLLTVTKRPSNPAERS